MTTGTLRYGDSTTRQRSGLPEYLCLADVAAAFPGIDTAAVRARLLADPTSRLRGGVGSGPTEYDLQSVIRAVRLQKESRP